MKKILFLTVMFLAAGAAAQAYVDSSHTMTEQYMLNTGYSREIVKMSNVANHDVYAPTDDERFAKTPKRLLKMIWRKIDPMAFPDENYVWHDIEYYPSFYDY